MAGWRWRRCGDIDSDIPGASGSVFNAHARMSFTVFELHSVHFQVRYEDAPLTKLHHRARRVSFRLPRSWLAAMSQSLYSDSAVAPEATDALLEVAERRRVAPRKQPWLFPAVFGAWALAVAYFGPRLLSLVSLADSGWGFASIAFFAVFAQIAWLYGFTTLRWLFSP
ncbi:MAG: hypothetical protein IPL62_11675 [Caulobacteraceae bacterium]|nr:hypothetical protein [Caulobacteraceae bacterium]